MTFDAKEYRNRVLSPYTRAKEPMLRRALGELKQNPQLKVPSEFDLAGFYDIPPQGDDAAIATQIDSVASAIKAAVQKPGGSRQPLDFHELIVARNPRLKTAPFWAEVQQRQVEQTQAALADLGRFAAADFAVLGVVTARELRDVAKGSGIPDSVTDADLARAVKAQGIAVVPDLPSVSAPAQVLFEISNGLKRTSAQSVMSVIFLEKGAPSSFSILDGFRSSAGSHSLTTSTVASAYAYAQRLPDTDENDAMGKILAAIKNSAKTDAELHDIVVAHFIDLGQRTFKEFGTRSGALKAFVDRTGIDKRDAARILQQVSPAGNSPSRSWAEVQSAIAAGALKEARRVYEALLAEFAGSTSGEQTKALKALEGTEARVEDLRRSAQSAQTHGDLETATRSLNEALTLCIDDEALAAAARALPPAPPVRLAVSPSEDARTVIVSWEPGFGSTEEVRYEVIRKLGAAPRNNTDGTSLGSAIQGTSFRDSNPPVAVDVFYGVSASRGGGASPAAVATVMILPPVTDVKVTSDPSSVTVRWTTPPEARTVDIVQYGPDGSVTALPPGAQSGTTSPGLRMGATYTFLLTAVYAGAAGETLRSSTVRVTGVPRGTARHVVELSVSAKAAADAKPEVCAEWPALEGYNVEIWHFAQRPKWLPGTRLSMAEIRRFGVQLAGRGSAVGGREGVQGTTEPGLRYYVAVTRDGEFGLVSAAEPYGTAPPVQNVRAERFGDEAVLSWDWPGPEYDVLVGWKGTTSGERTIAMNEYRTGGGCRVPVGAAGGTVTVASVAGEGNARWVSVPTSIVIEGTAAVVEYDVVFHRKLFGPPSTATLTFSIPDATASVGVVVIGHASKFIPFDATQGSVLVRTSVSAGSPRVEVSLPHVGKSPFWVRAFATSPTTRLVDPSPTRMKAV